MKLGSLFDGSGGFPLAGALNGIEPVWASEVEPYPIAVTRSRFPRMKHLGDVSKINGAEIEPVDVITFGSPCQDMSVAGKRAGLKHENKGDDKTTRSGLFYEAIRIIREMREATNGRYPTFAVWENVPGAFSSNKGEDFRCVLEELVRIRKAISVSRPAGGKWSPAGEIVGDGFSVAWRTLDAQYWGVPMRRKRIYLVADFAGGRAGEILFEREGLRGHPAACGAPGKDASADVPGSTGRSRGLECLHPWDCQSKRIYQPDGVYPTLPAMDCGGANNQAVIYALQGNGIDRADTAGCNGCGWRENICYTLNTIDRPAICFKTGQGAKARSIGASVKVTPTLGSEAGGNSVPSVCYQQVARTLTAEAEASPCIDRGQNVMCYDARGNGDGAHVPTLTGDHENRVTDYTATVIYRALQIGEYASPDGTASTMAARDFKSHRDLVVEHSKPPRRYIIRRLTPLECCRLQGFPDGWGVPDHKGRLSDDELAFWQRVRDTCAAISGKPTKKYSAKALTKWYNSLHTDSAEYKMWGNGIALPCAAFVLEGITREVEG
nr:MAG TPA: Cytosine specific methyltransferase [Caudoviricetes sp.]